MLNFLQQKGFKRASDATTYVATIKNFNITFNMYDATDMSSNAFSIKNDNCTMRLIGVQWQQVEVIINTLAGEKK